MSRRSASSCAGSARRSIEDICAQVIAEATSPRAGARRFVVRAARIDSTVVESDIRYPTDLGLAQDAARALAREADQARGAGRRRGAAGARTARARSPAGCAGVNRSIAARTGHSKRAGAAADRRGRRAARRARSARRAGSPPGCASAPAVAAPRAKLAAAERLERLCELAEKVCAQIELRLAGKPITDRLVSISDPDARPIRKGKLHKPTEFGYVMQLAELCENTRRGARGLILPGQHRHRLAQRVPAAARHRPTPRATSTCARARSRSTAASNPARSREHLPEPERLFISGHHAPHARKTNRRLAKFRVGAEGRISHLKRRYGLDRSRLKGHPGARTWAAWAILAYNLDTLALRAA